MEYNSYLYVMHAHGHTDTHLHTHTLTHSHKLLPIRFPWAMVLTKPSRLNDPIERIETILLCCSCVLLQLQFLSIYTKNKIRRQNISATYLFNILLVRVYIYIYILEIRRGSRTSKTLSRSPLTRTAILRLFRV